MLGQEFRAGLSLPIKTPPRTKAGIIDLITEEAAITAAPGEELRVEMAVSEGALVAQGAPLARLRGHPQIAFVAPMAGRVASITLRPGHRLGEIVLFREADGGRFRHDTAAASSGRDEVAMRALMQQAGLWRALRSRPFGHMPRADEKPAAIFVMAVDTRPHAPDPSEALKGKEEAFARGLDALTRLTEGPVFVCRSRGANVPSDASNGRLRIVTTGERHPQGLAGFQIHAHFPAGLKAPVWDIHAEEVAALGALLASGHLPETRLVSIAGAALSESRLVRCQPGADLRGLSYGAVRPGNHILLSGSALDGHEARWLAPRDRQSTVLPRHGQRRRGHWFGAALSRAARPLPIIPTAALEQAFGAALPAAAMTRALASGDDETAVRLGALSLLEEDLALADYVTAAEPRLSTMLQGILARIAVEEGG